MKFNFSGLKNTKFLILLISLAGIAFLFAEAHKNSDFKVFLDAARVLMTHETIYDKWLNNGYAKYYYSPLFAVLLVPFSYLPYYIPCFLWLCADVFFLYRIWKIISGKLNLSIFTKKEYRIFLLLALLPVIRFLLYNFDMVQMTCFILWSILESVQLIQKNKYVKGAFLLALAINIKIMPLAVIPYLLLRKKFIPVAYVLVFSVIFLYLPALLIGFKFNNFLLGEWFRVINPSNVEHSFDNSLGSHSLNAWIPTLLTNTGGELPLKRNFVDLDLNTVKMIVNCITAGLVLFTLYFTGLTFFKEAKSKIRSLWEISYIVLVIPLIFPHQEAYAFFLVFPAMAFISYYIVYQIHSGLKQISAVKWYIILILFCISFALMTLTSDLFIGRHLCDITRHYKTISYGTLLLTIVLAMCNPKQLDAASAGPISK
jgi:hypothetical protein